MENRNLAASRLLLRTNGKDAFWIIMRKSRKETQ